MFPFRVVCSFVLLWAVMSVCVLRVFGSENGRFIAEATASRPPNDNLADAIDISGVSTFSGTTAGATYEPIEAAYGQPIFGNTVWYRWTAPTTGDASFVIDVGSAASAVILGTNWDKMTIEADDARFFRAVEGDTYSICFLGGAGAFSGHWKVDQIPAPPNDFRRHPMLLTGSHVSVSGSFMNATRERSETKWWISSLWYQWVAPTNGLVRFGADDREMLVQLYPWVGNAFEVAAGHSYEFVAIKPIYKDFHFQLYLDLEPYRVTPTNILFETRTAILTPDFREESTTFKTNGSWNQFLHENWWELTPKATGVCVLELFPSDVGDVRLYVGTNSENLMLFAQGSALETRLTNGVPLEISVDTAQAQNFELRVRSFYTAPENNRFTNSFHLEGTNVVVEGAQNYLTPTDSSEPTPVPNGKHKGVWWSWYAADMGTTTITLNSHFLSSAAVYTGSALSALKRITGSTNADVAHVLQFPAAADTIYHLLVDSMDGTEGFYDLSVSQTVLPATTNDGFDQPTRISGAETVGHASTRGATREALEPVIFSGPNERSVWFLLENCLGGSNVITATSIQSPVPNIAVYTGDSFEALSLIVRGSGRVSFLADAAQPYRVAVETTAETDVSLFVSSANAWGGYAGEANLIKNGSFEDSQTGLPYWYVDGQVGAHIGDPGTPHGSQSLIMSSDAIYQDIPTTPGKTYELRFVCANDTDSDSPDNARVAVSWGDKSFSPMEVARYRWNYARFVLKADSETTRLRLEQSAHMMQLDAVSLVEIDVSAPPLFTSSLIRQSAYTGFDVALSPALRGTPPFDFQWYFGDTPIVGETNKNLFLQNITPDAAGDYFLVAANAYGKATGQVATLTVLVADVPEILLQPSGDSAVEGNFYSMAAIAVGTSPLSYQWFKGGNLLLSETNRNLVFPILQLSDAGTYTLVVRNSAGSATSVPATLLVNPHPNEPMIARVANFDIAGGAFAPVFDVDGRTMLSGTNYQVQLYAGASQDSLRPMGHSIPFRQGFAAGQFADGAVPLTGLDDLFSFYYQFRAWDASRGRTYEEARAAGGRFGFSTVVLHLLAGDASWMPLSDSFSLRGGRPHFLTGKLSIRGVSSDGLIIQLDGEAGLRYLIEKDEGGGWQPWQSALNSSGSITFTNAVSSATGRFRSRVLD